MDQLIQIAVNNGVGIFSAVVLAYLHWWVLTKSLPKLAQDFHDELRLQRTHDVEQLERITRMLANVRGSNRAGGSDRLP